MDRTLYSRIAPEVFGLGDTAGQRHGVFDERVGDAIAVGVDVLVGHRLGLFRDVFQFRAEQFDAVAIAVAGAFHGHRTIIVLHGELDGLAATAAGLVNVDRRLEAGKAALEVAKSIGADALDLELALDLAGEEIGQGIRPEPMPAKLDWIRLTIMPLESLTVR